LKHLAANAIAHLELLRATLYFTSIQTSFTLPHDIHFKVSRIENSIDKKNVFVDRGAAHPRRCSSAGVKNSELINTTTVDNE
jgi:hypothetical protein